MKIPSRVELLAQIDGRTIQIEANDTDVKTLTERGKVLRSLRATAEERMASLYPGESPITHALLEIFTVDVLLQLECLRPGDYESALGCGGTGPGYHGIAWRGICNLNLPELRHAISIVKTTLRKYPILATYTEDIPMYERDHAEDCTLTLRWNDKPHVQVWRQKFRAEPFLIGNEDFDDAYAEKECDD